MDQFETEEQQVEAIKRFWKENGLAIVAGAIIGLGGLWSWRYYTDTQMQAKETASLDYQAAVETLATNDTDATLEAFVDSTEQDGYKTIGAFVVAKQFVDNNELAKAADVLQNIVVSDTSSSLSAVAALRLADIQMQQESFDAVLVTVGKIESEAFQAQALATKGDALVKLQRFDEAKQAYSGALEKAPDDALVKMKLDNLAVLAGA